jgi:hypothetical protein
VITALQYTTSVHRPRRSSDTVDRKGPRTGLIRLSTNKLIDVDNAIIVHIEATTPLRQAEVTAAKRTIERSLECFDLSPAKLIGDTA